MDIHAELQTALESLVANFKAICETPKLTYSIDGQNVSWAEYFKMLADGIKEVNELVAFFDPVELRSQIL